MFSGVLLAGYLGVGHHTPIPLRRPVNPAACEVVMSAPLRGNRRVPQPETACVAMASGTSILPLRIPADLAQPLTILQPEVHRHISTTLRLQRMTSHTGPHRPEGLLRNCPTWQLDLLHIPTRSSGGRRAFMWREARRPHKALRSLVLRDVFWRALTRHGCLL